MRNIQEHRMRMKYFSAEGGKIAYVDAGSPAGIPILLLHGMPTSSWLYRYVIDELSEKGYRVIAPDALGFGNSEKPRELALYKLDKQAVRIKALMENLGIASWTQVCHDLGGPWTFEMLIKYPDSINKLVILNTSAYLEGFHPPGMLAGPMGF
jgi:haloalkane dehalogenase